MSDSASHGRFPHQGGRGGNSFRGRNFRGRGARMDQRSPGGRGFDGGLDHVSS